MVRVVMMMVPVAGTAMVMMSVATAPVVIVFVPVSPTEPVSVVRPATATRTTIRMAITGIPIAETISAPRIRGAISPAAIPLS